MLLECLKIRFVGRADVEQIDMKNKRVHGHRGCLYRRQEILKRLDRTL